MLIMFAVFLVMRTTKLVSREDPFFSMLHMGSPDQDIDLFQLNHFFAVQKLDPRAGRLVAEHVRWEPEGPKVKTQLNFTDCNNYYPGGIYEHEISEGQKTLLPSTFSSAFS
mgnify:CR=1 FL=1